MGAEYKIRAWARNPEMLEDNELPEGIEADGFVLLTIKDNKPSFTCMYNVSVKEVARFFLRKDDPNSWLLRQAVVVADGFAKAEEIQHEYEKSRHMQIIAGDLAKKIAESLKQKEDKDEDEDEPD